MSVESNNLKKRKRDTKCSIKRKTIDHPVQVAFQTSNSTLQGGNSVGLPTYFQLPVPINLVGKKLKKWRIWFCSSSSTFYFGPLAIYLPQITSDNGGTSYNAVQNYSPSSNAPFVTLNETGVVHIWYPTQASSAVKEPPHSEWVNSGDRLMPSQLKMYFNTATSTAYTAGNYNIRSSVYDGYTPGGPYTGIDSINYVFEFVFSEDVQP